MLACNDDSDSIQNDYEDNFLNYTKTNIVILIPVFQLYKEIKFKKYFHFERR